MRPSDITFIVTYHCPGCQATLEARVGEGPGGWLRCPRCGQSSLPPDTETLPRPRPEPIGSGDDDVLVIGPPTAADRAHGPSVLEALGRYPGGVRRVTLGVGLILALGGVITAFLGGHVGGVASFGAVALLLLMSLLAPKRRP